MSWSKFPIAKPIRKSLKEQGFEKPLPIQVRALKATLLGDKHVLGAARTGSGKTLAYAIPIVNRILNDDPSLKSSSDLKRKMCKVQKKKEDFELIDGEMVAIEDMIVDKYDDENENQNDDEVSSNMSNDDDDEPAEDSTKERICPDAIVLVPTRELAVQVKEEIDKLCKYTDIRTCIIIGGISQDKQVRKLNRAKPQIIIATPGRLYDMVQSDTVSYINMQSIASIQTIVIDEADRMVQRGHFEEMIKIIDTIKESKQFRKDFFPYKVYLFSATLTFLHELPERLKKNILDSKQGSKKNKDKKSIDPKEHTKKNKIRKLLALFGIERADTRVIDLNDDSSFGRPSSDQLTEFRINCTPQDKDVYLYYFLMQNPNSRTLIFCNSKDCLRRLSNVLKFLGYEALKLHSEMDQKKRLSNLERFRAKSNAILIATDIAARGLDIKDLENVVHYQVPKTCESYIHRSGRTARVNQNGTCLTLCEPKEIPFYRRLCNTINGGQDLELYDVDPDLKALLKSRVLIAQECDIIDHRLREKKSNQNWFAKAAQECDIELDDEDIRQLSGKGKSKQLNLEEEARDRRKLAQLEKQLKSLMKRPLITRGSLVRQSMATMNKALASS
uniref:ATP-dependent RNA helicase n=1 Tax=Aceria tosichella TaxID=561515 RepID=A0A6G1SHJ6_9ACAR